MTAQQLASTQLVDGIPALRLLEGLGRLYHLVLVVDADRRVIWMSNALGALCGSAEFHIGRDVRAILPELPKLPHPEQVFALRSQFRKHGFLSNVRVDLNGADGRTMPLEVNMLPVPTTDEDRPLFVVIARRVKDREQSARISSHGVGGEAAILDSAPDAVLAVDDRGFVTYANPAVQRLVGTDPDDIVDRPIALLLAHASDLERLVASLGTGERAQDQDLSLRHQNGSEIHVSASASTLREHGHMRGTVLVLRDVTARRRTEVELEHKNRELEHCVHALAHDLRSPLVALLGFSRLLRQDYESRLDDTGTHYVDRIEQAGRTMEDLIHDLLELSRIGQPGERRGMIDPRAILQQIAAEVKPRLDDAGIELVIQPAPPPVYGDRTRLYQVFSNLIGNAIDHMGPCDRPRIEVSIHDEPEGQRISVIDFGRGISPEHHEQIFDVFQSLGPRGAGRRGSGIGLAIVKKIAETHGGRVWVDSDLGRGAAFHVIFPRA